MNWISAKNRPYSDLELFNRISRGPDSQFMKLSLATLSGKRILLVFPSYRRMQHPRFTNMRLNVISRIYLPSSVKLIPIFADPSACRVCVETH